MALSSRIRLPASLFLSFFLLGGLSRPTPVAAQGLISTELAGVDYIRPAPCWTTNMAFYDPVAFPYFEVNGYYFDANPFITKRWVQTDEMLMMSSRGLSLIDMSGRKVWSPATILVNCFEISFYFGLYTQRYAVVSQTYGTVQDRTLACSGGGAGPTGFTSLWDSNYDPYTADFISSAETDCTEPGADGTGSSGGSGWECHYEWITLEISYDGITWQTWWEGDALVCQ